MLSESTSSYIYSAYANSIGAALTLPQKTALTDVPCAALPPTGGLISQTRENIVFKIDSFEIFRIGRASATVHGERRGRNFCTYATATVENLNVMGIVTADLITNRVTSMYPVDPAERDADPDMHKATFFLGGATFHNLKIAGTPVNVQPTRVVMDGFKVGRSTRAPTSIFDDQAPPIPIRQFGTVYFGEIAPYSGKVIASMLRIELGCAVEGSQTFCVCCTNGVGPGT